MPTVALYNTDGNKVGDIELNESVFGAEVRPDVMHEVVVNYLANQRQGTQSTKTRTEVSGGGIKPWRQKGTGRARQGSIRAPQWVGGGVALGPKPIIVLEALKLDEIKTSSIAKILSNLGVTEKALIVLPENDKNVVCSARNIKGVDTTFVGSINTYEVLNHTKCIIVKDAVAKLEEVYA